MGAKGGPCSQHGTMIGESGCCRCLECVEWRKNNLYHGSLYAGNLTQESIDALEKQNAPRGARAARRLSRVNHVGGKRRR